MSPCNYDTGASQEQATLVLHRICLVALLPIEHEIWFWICSASPGSPDYMHVSPPPLPQIDMLDKHPVLLGPGSGVTQKPRSNV